MDNNVLGQQFQERAARSTSSMSSMDKQHENYSELASNKYEA
jgi:hypothetical protein